ncbi:MAG: GDYXXLXY domain-containing protein [Peptococcaceae bacterium]|jgi:hypothetical protein|nr:GDYXXLXY domain-containing protein [Peptococcaceae bacterium]
MTEKASLVAAAPAATEALPVAVEPAAAATSLAAAEPAPARPRPGPGKRLKLAAAAVYFLILLLLPGYMVFRHYNVLLSGERFKFAVTLYDPYDPFRGRYVDIRARDVDLYGGTYTLLARDEAGYAVVTGQSYDRPAAGVYAKDLFLDRYYMDERLAPTADTLLRELSPADSVYALVAVKDGDYVIEGLYLNDVAVEDYLTLSPPSPPLPSPAGAL